MVWIIISLLLSAVILVISIIRHKRICNKRHLINKKMELFILEIFSKLRTTSPNIKFLQQPFGYGEYLIAHDDELKLCLYSKTNDFKLTVSFHDVIKQTICFKELEKFKIEYISICQNK